MLTVAPVDSRKVLSANVLRQLALAFGLQRRIASLPMASPLTELTEGGLNQLVSDGVKEGKSVEYKQTISLDQSEQIRKFLASVSSFANAAGGDLIFGIKANDGVPVDVVGLSGLNFDQAQLRLEQLVRSHIEPKVPGIEYREVVCQKGPVLVLRIPKTYSGPHIVTFNDDNRFYARGAAGRILMDLSEIRSAFTLADATSEKVRRWRMDRVAQILSEEIPCKLWRGPRVAMHFMPLRSFDPLFKADLSPLGKDRRFLVPIGNYGTPGVDFDGAYAYVGGNLQKTEGYTYVLRNGCIEAVTTSIFSDHSGQKTIPSAMYEERLYSFLPKAFELLKQIGCDVPLFIALSLLNVKGYAMAMSPGRWNHTAVPINRDHLYLPEIFIESFGVNSAETLRDSFNMIWNACGWQRSPNYDDDGKWKPADL